MASLDILVKALDTAHWEMSEAFKGLPDNDVWRRADPRLLSVGELASHIAYGEAHSFLGIENTESVLVVNQVRYYPYTVSEPFELALGSEQLLKEVQRVHLMCKDSFTANPQDSETPNPKREGWSWGMTLEYMAFHVAYHTGQIYSVRHLLGHETVDN